MNQLITWTEEQFGTKIGVADTEHQNIFTLLNRLNETVAAGDQKGAAGQLDHLIGVVASHFKTEEDLMTANNYPDFAAHKAAHDQLVGVCLGLQKQVHAGEAQLTRETTEFVRDWLVNHIPTIDRPYGPFLNGCGIR